MENKPVFLKIIFGSIVFLILLFLGIYYIPWQEVNWGKLQLFPGKTLTVVGEAETKQKNQIATFTVGANAVNDNKEIAVNEVNKKVEAIIQSVKNFGIKSEDIKTENLNIYQEEERYYEEGREKTRPGQWRVSNSITITLRDVDKASALADLLTKSGATNVYGPTFSLDETQEAEISLLKEAIENAKNKAEVIAQSIGDKVGKIINVSEGYQAVGVFRPLQGGGGGAPMEPGTGKVKKTVTVVFELK